MLAEVFGAILVANTEGVVKLHTEGVVNLHTEGVVNLVWYTCTLNGKPRSTWLMHCYISV